jgi:ribonuclease HI
LVPSHGGLEWNKIADKLAKEGTTLHTKETNTSWLTEKTLESK